MTKKRFHPAVETLEDRNLPAGIAGINSAGTLVIRGTSGHDTATVSNFTDRYGRAWYQVAINGARSYFRPSQVTSGIVAFVGYGGNDYFANRLSRYVLWTRAWGDAGNDTLVGSSRPDTLWGSTGRDFLYGNAGGDKIFGEDDDDYIDAGSGNDWAQGGNHNDRVYGGSGLDTLFGEAGLDMLKGESEADQLVGGNDSDTLYGDSGNDSLWGNGGWDELVGGDGYDRLDGGADGIADALYGGFQGDRFVPEWFWDGFNWVNRDYPNDFNSAEGDSFT